MRLDKNPPGKRCELDTVAFSPVDGISVALSCCFGETQRAPWYPEVEGMTALAEARPGKRTLRTHALEFKRESRLGIWSAFGNTSSSRERCLGLPSHECPDAGKLGAGAGELPC